MSKPTYHERCNDKAAANPAEYLYPHFCFLEKGHNGNHECPCGVEWEIAQADATGEP